MDLKKHIDLLIAEGERLPQYNVKSYLFQLCNGLYHLSKQGVMHRCDLVKPPPASLHISSACQRLRKGQFPVLSIRVQRQTMCGRAGSEC